MERNGPGARTPDPGLVETALEVTRLLTGVSVRAAAVEDVTLPQLRVLTMVAGRDRCNVAAVATGLGVHPSNATRVVDRLVRAGLLDRQADPSDRRHLVLGLTGPGQDLLDHVDGRRREEVLRLLGRMSSEELAGAGPVLRAVAEAGSRARAEAG